MGVPAQFAPGHAIPAQSWHLCYEFRKPALYAKSGSPAAGFVFVASSGIFSPRATPFATLNTLYYPGQPWATSFATLNTLYYPGQLPLSP